MHRFAIVVSALLPILVSLPAHAQQLQPGKWTGTVTPPGEQPLEVTYDVTVKGDTLGITVNAGEHGSFSFNDAKVADKTLTFWFEPGPRVDCTLAFREDGAYAGSCRDSQGGIATMVMVPPKKE